MRFPLSLALFTFLASACGGGSQTPTAPTVTAPVVTMTNLVVAPDGGGRIKVGDVATVGAYATFSDGNSRYVPAQWSSSNTNVIAVDSAAGSIRGLSAGVSTLTATASGRSASAQFFVDATISGSWTGFYVVERCQGTGSNGDFYCTVNRGVTEPGAVLPISMDLTQSGSTITGIVSFGQVRANVSGSLRSNGLFSLSGTATSSGGPSLTITRWDAEIQQDTMVGYVTFEGRAPTYHGVATVQTRLANVRRR
jgi:hypothetical protein